MNQYTVDHILAMVGEGRLPISMAMTLLDGMLDCAEANRRRAAEDAARVARAIETLRGGEASQDQNAD